VFTCEPIIAAAGALTNRVNFLWSPVDVVRRAPINIAQMVLTLDHATKGRFAYVLAHGQIDHMRQTGISRIGTKDKFHDRVQIIRKLTHQTGVHGGVHRCKSAAPRGAGGPTGESKSPRRLLNRAPRRCPRALARVSGRAGVDIGRS
jgi:alkanesulfonate monooxygenase SsuD/methylene tetrahydromethanopterin reductase-like flavin-dependent oxidoreductase (luciferase family)